MRYVGEALALADTDVDFSEFDIFYIVPVRSASAITYSPTYIDDAPYHGSPTRAVLDGVNIRWGVTTGQDAWDSWGSKVLNHETGHIFGLPDLYAFAVELRLPLFNDGSSADSGVLIYKVDSSVTSGEGPVRVIDASPNAPAGVLDLDTACFGTGPEKVRSFTDTAAGVTITVIKQSGENAFVRVEKTTDTIFEQ